MEIASPTRSTSQLRRSRGDRKKSKEKLHTESPVKELEMQIEIEDDKKETKFGMTRNYNS